MEFCVFDGDRVDSVHVFGQVLDIWVVPRRAEIARRAGIGAGPISDHACLRALMGMPDGEPVAFAALEGDALLTMDALLGLGAVEIDGNSAVRRAIPPVDLAGFYKEAGCWEDVQGVTFLRTHGPRCVAAPPRLARRAIREIDGEIGVAAISADGALRVLREPRRPAALRPSWQRWAISEAAYAQWLPAQGAAQRRPAQ